MAIIRRSVFLCIVFFLAGCASGPILTAPSPEELLKNECAVAFRSDPDPHICEALPASYGSKQHPVEWGSAGVEPLYAGRLLCPDGSRPEVLGRIRDGKTSESTSPLRLFAKRTRHRGSDILNRWTLRCGDELIQFWANNYRCGNGCAPAPLRLLPIAAQQASGRSSLASKRGDFGEAISESEEALRIAPDAEVLHVQLATALVRAGKFERSLEAAEAGLALHPESFALRFARSLALRNLESFEEAEALLDELLATTNQRERAHVLCEKAIVLAATKRKEEAFPLAAEACERGSAACCHVKPEG